MPETPTEIIAKLTPRELQVAAGIRRGQTLAEIADTLDIGFETVRFHVRRLRARTGIHRKSLLAVWAAEHRDAIDKALEAAHAA